ncbi:MAG: pinensin family lanthipeptide [Cyclobacteriaceae bacterium]
MKKRNKLSLADLKVESFATSEIKGARMGDTDPVYTCHPETCDNNAAPY